MLSLATFALLAQEVHEDGRLGWDLSGLRTADAADNGTLDALMRLLSQAGGAWCIAPLAVTVALPLPRGRRDCAVPFLALTLGGFALNPLREALFARPRPALGKPLASAGGYAFPGGRP